MCETAGKAAFEAILHSSGTDFIDKNCSRNLKEEIFLGT